jgi:hypothetical protein
METRGQKMKTIQVLAAAMMVMGFALAATGCNHSRDDEDNDRTQTFDQVGEVRVFDEHTAAPLSRPTVSALAKARTTTPTFVAHAKSEVRFDQVGEADMAE